MSNPSKRHEEEAREIAKECYPMPGFQQDGLTTLIATALAAAEAELLREMMEPSEQVIAAGVHYENMGDMGGRWRAMLTVAAKERGIELETVDAT